MSAANYQPGMDVKRLTDEFGRLKAARSTWDSHWRDIAEITWPEMRQFGETRTPGEKLHEKVYESTAGRAAEQGAAALGQLVTPRGQAWHRLRAPDDALNEDPAVKAWFDDTNKRLFKERERPGAGFYAAMDEVYLSLLVFGTACLLVEEVFDTETAPDAMNVPRVVRYQAVPLNQVYVKTDGFGKVSCVYRVLPLSAYAIKSRFGDRTPQRVEAALKSDPGCMFDLVHAVEPRPLGGRKGPLDHRFDGVLFLPEEQAPLSAGGYHEMPYLVPRWRVINGETYGRGPGARTLPDNRTLQAQEKTSLISGQKIADPPLLAHRDGVIGVGGRRVSLQSGAVNYGGIDDMGRPMVMPLATGARLDITFEMMERKRQDIEAQFIVPILRVLSEHPDMTATQVQALLQEKAQIIGPPVGRIQTELLGPMITRELGLMYRQDRLTDVPAALAEAGGAYEVEYESQATRAIRSEEALAVAKWHEIMAPTIALDPPVVHLLKTEETGRMVAEVLGVPGKIVATSEEMRAMREALAEQAQQQAMVEGAPQVAKAAKDFAGAQREARAA